MRQNDDIREYARGDRRGKAANRLERRAVGDPFLHEALEGYRAVDGDLSADIARLERRLARRVGGAVRWRWACAAAASVAVLLSLAVWLWPSPGDERAERLALAPRVGQEAEVPRALAFPAPRDSAALSPSSVAAAPRDVLAVAADAGQRPAAAGAQKEAASGVAAKRAAARSLAVASADSSVRPLSRTMAPAAGVRARVRGVGDAAADSRGWPWVSGVVTDSLGRPLPGATVLAEGADWGTATDGAGRYRLALPPETDTLVFSFVGMKTCRAAVSGGDSLVVALTEQPMRHEIVVTGYQAVPRRRTADSLSVEPCDRSRVLAEVDVRGYHRVEKRSFTGAAQVMSVTPLDAFNACLTERLDSLGALLLERGVDAFKVAFRVGADGRVAGARVSGALSSEERRMFRDAVLHDAPLCDTAWRGKRVRGVVRLRMDGGAVKAAFVPDGDALRTPAARPAR